METSQPPSMLNPITNSAYADRSSKKKKRRKSQLRNSHHQQQKETQSERLTQWKSEKQQQIYSSKLLQALNQVRSQPRRSGKVVREAADNALAAAARGRTLWSRSILTNRLKVKFKKQTNKRLKKTTTAVVTRGSSSSRSIRRTRLSVLRLKGKNLPAVQTKVRVLGRLVPGCRKQPMPVVLEEVTDYIAAIEMQVRAMSRLAELLSGGSTTKVGSSSSAAA
jgi:HD-GYP domain-containing protein (c-di-GMP phosphodiesterase class II)